jgi:hypothetical protein
MESRASQELKLFGDWLDLLFGRRADTESGNHGLAAEEVFAARINNAENRKARRLGRVLRAEQLVESAGHEAHFGAGRLWKILVVSGQNGGVRAAKKCA